MNFGSDYLREDDFSFSKIEIEELKNLINILNKEIKDINFHKSIYSHIQKYFKDKEKFDILVEGFEKLKELTKENHSSDYFFFIQGIVENFKNYTENIMHGKIHYYDNAFLADIIQFENQFFKREDENHPEIDFF